MAGYESIESAAASGGTKLIGKRVFDTEEAVWKFLQGYVPMIYAGSGWVPASDANPLPVVFANATIVVETADGVPIEVSGSVEATQSGVWSTRLLDGNGQILAGAVEAPSDTARGLVVRTVGPNEQGDGNNDPLQPWSSRISDGLGFITSTVLTDIRCVDVREHFPKATPFLEDNLSGTPVLVVGAACELRMLVIENTGSEKAYVQLFDASDDSAVTPGTTPPLLSFFIPGNGAYELPVIPLKFVAGLVVCATTTPKGGTSPASDLVLNAAYI